MSEVQPATEKDSISLMQIKPHPVTAILFAIVLSTGTCGFFRVTDSTAKNLRSLRGNLLDVEGMRNDAYMHGQADGECKPGWSRHNQLPEMMQAKDRLFKAYKRVMSSKIAGNPDDSFASQAYYQATESIPMTGFTRHLGEEPDNEVDNTCYRPEQTKSLIRLYNERAKLLDKSIDALDWKQKGDAVKAVVIIGAGANVLSNSAVWATGKLRNRRRKEEEKEKDESPSRGK